MSVEAPPAPAEAEVETAAEVAVEATAESVADQPVTITETCDDAEFWGSGGAVTAQVLPPSLLTSEQLTLMYGKEFWLNPDYQAAYDAETQQVTAKLLNEKYEIESEIETHKTKAAASRAELKAKERELKNHHEERARQRGKQPPVRQLTIDSAPPPDARPAANAESGADVNFPKSVEDAQRDFFNDLYDRLPVDRLVKFGATKADVEKLHAGDLKEGGPFPIVTMRDLRLFTNPYKENPSFTRGFGDIKGFGGKAVDRIQKAQDDLLDWWGNKGGQAEFAKELGLEIPQAATPRVEEGGSSDGGSDPADEGQGGAG